MAAPSHLDALSERLLHRPGLGRLAHGVRKRQQVIRRGAVVGRVSREPDHLPPARCGHPLAMAVAEVVAVRLGVCRQRAENRCLVGIDIGQGRHRRTRARAARTGTGSAHGLTLPPADRWPGDCESWSVRVSPKPGPRHYNRRVSRAAEPVVPARSGAPRDRHGRGPRGPLALAGPLTDGEMRMESRRDQFDQIVLSLVDRHLRRWADALGDIEFGTEDVPKLPDDWRDEPVPFGALTKPRAGQPGRIVVFRRPVEMRAKTRLERMALVDEVLVEHIADLLGKDPAEIDP